MKFLYIKLILILNVATMDFKAKEKLLPKVPVDERLIEEYRSSKNEGELMRNRTKLQNQCNIVKRFLASIPREANVFASESNFN